jgi:hypothetical protein
MTRYFYPAARAHHAYSMAIDFGMKFEKRDGFWTPEGLLTVTGAGGYLIDIAQESHQLLLPRAGDVIRFGDNQGHSEPYVVVDTDFTDDFFGNVALLEAGEASWWFWGDLFDKSIIQRGGVAFHWPESAERQPL